MSGKKFLIIIPLVALTFIFFRPQKSALAPEQKISTPPHNLIIEKSDGSKIYLEVGVADNEAQRVQGLSDRPSLAEREGLLFIFPSSEYQSFWMKDMHFAIDIIWLDTNWQIIDITPNIAPETFPKTFSPRTPAHYVLEVNAGFASQHNLSIGEKITPPTELNQ